MFSMRKMEIFISPYQSGDNQQKQQTINFFNVFNGDKEVFQEPVELPYEEGDNSTLALLNYKEYSEPEAFLEVKEQQGVAVLTDSEDLRISIYKQEIGYNTRGEIVALTPLEEVVGSTGSFVFTDYNVANNHWYRYVVYPANQDSPLTKVENDIKTQWYGWSITELHPNGNGQYTASINDVWVFDANVETGEQTQNIIRTEQQTLGQFPRYSQGLSNYIAGSVSCLLGEVLPMSYITEYGTLMLKGGYTEAPHSSGVLSSNEKVAMLQQWRQLVYSSNPKLLKDRKGNSYLVTLTGPSNQVQDKIGYQPDKIAFSWVQIGETKNIKITG